MRTNRRTSLAPAARLLVFFDFATGERTVYGSPEEMPTVQFSRIPRPPNRRHQWRRRPRPVASAARCPGS
ncbi:hypothetical protein GCM10027605_03430 [Micromonospora zhanjiangensis]